MGHALPTAVDEREIVASCQQDAERAFERLCRAYGPPLTDFCRGRLGNPFEAEDACQEALVKAYKAFSTFDPAAELWPWLATIAGHVCSDIRRAHRRDPIWTNDPATLEGDLAYEIEDEVGRRAREELVSGAFREMPDRYRETVYLREMEGWSYGEIAELQHTTVAAVRSALVRGRCALRSHLRQFIDANPLLPLPAIVPFGWVRRLLAPSDGAMRGRSFADMTAALPAMMPNLANVAAALFVVAAAVATPALHGGGGPADAGAGARHSLSASEWASSSELAPDGAGLVPAGSGADAPSGGQRTALRAEVAPEAAAGVATRGGVGVTQDEERRRFGRSIEVEVAGQPVINVDSTGTITCNESEAAELACDTSDAVVDAAGEEPDR